MKTVQVQLCNPATASFYVLARHMHMSHMYIVRLHCTSMCRLFTLCRYTLDTMYLAQVQVVQANTCRSLFPFYALACSQGTQVNTIEFTVNEGRICTTSFILFLLSYLHFPTRACRPILVVHLPSVIFL